MNANQLESCISSRVTGIPESLRLNSNWLAAVILIATVATTAMPAFAKGPEGDYFGRNTGPGPSQPRTTVHVPKTPLKLLYNYGDSPPQKWFSAIDTQVVMHMVTPEEQVVLSRPWGSPPQLERVIAWTNTAAMVAKKYRALARNLRYMPAPTAMSADPTSPVNIATYQHTLENQFEDQASVLEAYIKPRPAARTREELERELAQVHQESQAIIDTSTHLAEMESKIRSHFNVPTARYNDKLMQYATSPTLNN